MENIINSPIFFWLAFAAAVGGRILDMQSSRGFRYHNLTENNSWMRDEYGNILWIRNIIVTGGIFGGIALWQTMTDHAPVPAIFILIIGILSAIQAIINTSGKKKKRKKQVEIFRKLYDHIDGGSSQQTISEFFNVLAWTYEGENVTKEVPSELWKLELTYVNLFAWLDSEKPNIADAQAECIRKICEVAVKPESEWFPA